MSEQSVTADIFSFREIIGLWPSPEAMADDIGAKAPAVRKWGQRDRIPSEWWDSILGSDVAGRNGLTAELMARLSAEKRAPALSEARP